MLSKRLEFKIDSQMTDCVCVCIALDFIEENFNADAIERIKNGPLKHGWTVDFDGHSTSMRRESTSDKYWIFWIDDLSDYHEHSWFHDLVDAYEKRAFARYRKGEKIFYSQLSMFEQHGLLDFYEKLEIFKQKVFVNTVYAQAGVNFACPWKNYYSFCTCEVDHNFDFRRALVMTCLQWLYNEELRITTTPTTTVEQGP